MSLQFFVQGSLGILLVRSNQTNQNGRHSLWYCGVAGLMLYDLARSTFGAGCRN